MRASKENVAEARKELAEVEKWILKAKGVPGGPRGGQAQLDRLHWVREMLNVVHRRVPTEASYDRDARRRKARKTS